MGLGTYRTFSLQTNRQNEVLIAMLHSEVIDNLAAARTGWLILVNKKKFFPDRDPHSVCGLGTESSGD